MIVTLRAADVDDVVPAVALLHRAHLASPTGRLLGSATTPRSAPFADLFTAGLRLGRVELAVNGDRIDGVACWIDHPRSAPSPSCAMPRTGVGDLLARLHITDLLVPVPDSSVHQHLAFLGTRPGYNARAVTDLLLHRQSLLNDRHGHTFYMEVHDESMRAWLLRSGYHDHGVTLGTDTDPESYLLSRAVATPPGAP